MEVIKDCILMKDPSTFSFDSPENYQNPYTIGILLAIPLQFTTLDLLSNLLSITQNEKIPDTVRLGSLCKFFRHFSDIQRYIEVKSCQTQIFSLLSTGCQCMNQIFALQESRDLKDFLVKSFKRSIERLTFEFRTQIQVLQIVSSAMKYKSFADFPSIIFKIPAKVIENALSYKTLNYATLLSTTEDIWRIIKNFQPKDFDPIKNVGFFLVSELILITENSSVTLTYDLLLNYSGQLAKSQEFKVLGLYKGLCDKLGAEIDEVICLKFGELQSRSFYEPSPWDLIEETPVYMDVVIPETLLETVKRVIDQLKSTHIREYLKYETIEKEILSISKSYRKDQGVIYTHIINLIENDEKSKLRFWKTFASAARKLRFFTFDQTKGLSDLINKLEREDGKIVRNEEVKNFMSSEKWLEKVGKEVSEYKVSQAEYEKISFEIQRFEEMVKEEFPLCEIQPIGSIQYKLFQKDSAVDLLILGQSESGTEFFNVFCEFLRKSGDVVDLKKFVQFKMGTVFHLHFNSRIPQVTCRLIDRYNQSQNVNSFLHYLKIWGKSLNLPENYPKGYFWTLIGLFFLSNTSPPTIKNLLLGSTEDPEILEGYNIWTDPTDYPSLETPIMSLLLGFFKLLSTSTCVIFNTRTGEVKKSSEYLWAVTDLFTDNIVGIPICELERTGKRVKSVYEDLLAGNR